MRRSMVILVMALAACADAPGGDAVIEAFDAATSTSPTTTTVPETTTTTPTPTTAPATTSTAPEAGMCGDWIPVVTDRGTTCVPPKDTLLPYPEPFMPWAIPSVDAAAVDEPWFHPPLALIDLTAVHLMTPTADATYSVEPWVLLDWFASDLRVASDATIVMQESGRDPITGEEFWPGVALHRPDASPVAYVPEGAIRLYDVARVDGVDVMVVTGWPVGPNEHLAVLRVDDPTVQLADLGWAGGPAFGVTSVDVVDELAVIAGWQDESEFLEYVDERGDRLDRPDPWDHLHADDGVVARAATLSPDGDRVSWAEGPDSGRGGVWLLRSADVDSAAIRLEWDVFPDVDPARERSVHSIHDVGSHIVVNRIVGAGDGGSEALPALVIALGYEEPGEHLLPHAGIVVPVPFASG